MSRRENPTVERMSRTEKKPMRRMRRRDSSVVAGETCSRRGKPAPRGGSSSLTAGAISSSAGETCSRRESFLPPRGSYSRRDGKSTRSSGGSASSVAVFVPVEPAFALVFAPVPPFEPARTRQTGADTAHATAASPLRRQADVADGEPEDKRMSRRQNSFTKRMSQRENPLAKAKAPNAEAAAPEESAAAGGSSTSS